MQNLCTGRGLYRQTITTCLIYEMIVELSPLKFQDRTFYILSNEQQCVVQIEAAVFAHLTKAT